MRRRVLLTIAAISVMLLVNWKSAGADKEEGTARAGEIKTDTAALSDARHLTIGSGKGMLYVKKEAG